MSERPAPRLRVDAARNSERIVTAAREAFAERGVQVQLEEIAQLAGVSTATLYRRFATKDDLVKAVLERQFTEVIGPAIERAQEDCDPQRAVVTALEAALSVAACERNTLAAAASAGTIMMELGGRFFGVLGLLIRRAQDAGVVRRDLTDEDVPRMFMMVVGTLPSFVPGDDGWRRYLALLLDGLSPTGACPLPPLNPGRGSLPCPEGST